MLALTGTPQIFLYRQTTDLRKSFDGLGGLVQLHFGDRLYAGAFFVFVNRRRTLVMILYWDRDGLAVWAKRLEQGTFRLPVTTAERVELSVAQLTLLLEGITPLRQNRRYRRPAAALG
jgi:transposase